MQRYKNLQITAKLSTGKVWPFNIFTVFANASLLVPPLYLAGVLLRVAVVVDAHD